MYGSRVDKAQYDPLNVRRFIAQRNIGVIEAVYNLWRTQGCDVLICTLLYAMKLITRARPFCILTDGLNVIAKFGCQVSKIPWSEQYSRGCGFQNGISAECALTL